MVILSLIWVLRSSAEGLNLAPELLFDLGVVGASASLRAASLLDEEVDHDLARDTVVLTIQQRALLQLVAGELRRAVERRVLRRRCRSISRKRQRLSHESYVGRLTNTPYDRGCVLVVAAASRSMAAHVDESTVQGNHALVTLRPHRGHTTTAAARPFVLGSVVGLLDFRVGRVIRVTTTRLGTEQAHDVLPRATVHVALGTTNATSASDRHATLTRVRVDDAIDQMSELVDDGAIDERLAILYEEDSVQVDRVRRVIRGTSGGATLAIDDVRELEGAAVVLIRDLDALADLGIDSGLHFGGHSHVFVHSLA